VICRKRSVTKAIIMYMGLHIRLAFRRRKMGRARIRGDRRFGRGLSLNSCSLSEENSVEERGRGS